MALTADNATERHRLYISKQRGGRNPRPPNPLFGDGIPRSLPPRVSLAKSTSAPLRF